jgi:hypothetical protein
MMMGMREKGGVERAMGVEKEKKLMRGRGGRYNRIAMD